MSNRFESSQDPAALIHALSNQRLVHHNDAIARKLALVAELEEYQPGKQFYLRGDVGVNVLFLLLQGSVELTLQDRRLGTLEREQFFGEFPLLDPGLDYTVSVVAREKTVVAKISEPQLCFLASEYPEIWKNVARELATRLRASSEAGRHSSDAVKPDEVSIGDLWKRLTIPQISRLLGALLTTFAAVATVAYRLGALNVLGKLQ
jgi:CRP-like cAMP-binding protein